jgi:ATP-binding cassette subfamily E protein 1
MSNIPKESLTRIAIISKDKCRPKKCRLECKRECPVVRQGYLCITVTAQSKTAVISEQLCTGCGLCIKKCPFGAIQIINLPTNIDKDTIHRFGPNQFKLHRLPTPRPGSVLGLVGANGTGKSLALKILSGGRLPNLGRFKDSPDLNEIITYFRGSELQNYFIKLAEGKLKAIIKPQYVDAIPNAVRGTVDHIVTQKDVFNMRKRLYHDLDLGAVLDRNIADLSGGELQRFAIAVTCVQNVSVYMFDEPSSYLDVKQRLKASDVIRSLTSHDTYVIVVEHDLSVLDYLSDFVCLLYGVPGAYGVVTMPFSVREGINIFLSGYLPTENVRFRNWSLNFKIADTIDVEDKHRTYEYPDMDIAMNEQHSQGNVKTLGDFKLHIDAGQFTDSEIIVMLGENGTGKTTMIKMLVGLLKPDNGIEVPNLLISYKPQKIAPRKDVNVRALLQEKLGTKWQIPQFMSDIVKPLQIESLLDKRVLTLSGGELQRLAITLALGKPADVYLIDEPSAYLDSEQRIIVARVIKRFILNSMKTAFIVDHDFIMATYLADRVIVFEGTPSINCNAGAPQSLLSGMNKFLRQLDVSLRRDRESYRPRINKKGSVKDRKQKEEGRYFYYE